MLTRRDGRGWVKHGREKVEVEEGWPEEQSAVMIHSRWLRWGWKSSE